MTDVPTLIVLRDRQRREHRASSRTHAEIYRARHEQLRREVRRERIAYVLHTVAEIGALALVAAAVTTAAIVASLPV